MLQFAPTGTGEVFYLLEVLFVRPSGGHGRKNGMPCDERAGRDDFKAPARQYVAQFHEGVVVFPVAVGDQGNGRGVVAPEAFQLRRADHGNAPGEHRHVHHQQIVFRQTYRRAGSIAQQVDGQWRFTAERGREVFGHRLGGIARTEIHLRNIHAIPPRLFIYA